ncbi:MAG: hypothetical protein ACXW2E_00850 [Nitrososphaeraceae archaeon]
MNHYLNEHKDNITKHTSILCANLQSHTITFMNKKNKYKKIPIITHAQTLSPTPELFKLHSNGDISDSVYIEELRKIWSKIPNEKLRDLYHNTRFVEYRPQAYQFGNVSLVQELTKYIKEHNIDLYPMLDMFDYNWNII